MNSKDKIKNKNAFGKSFWTIIISFGIIICIILSFPYFFVEYSWFNLDFRNTGQIGDTIGGITGPFIAIIASFLTFIAFWVQYQANEQQKKDLQIERFENKFYEMLRLHKENVNELSTINFFGVNNTGKFKVLSESPVNGRQVFFEMNKLLNSLFKKSLELPNMKLSANKFEEAYTIFFWGINHKQNVKVGPGGNIFVGFGNILDGLIESFIDYNGVSFYLGHYYRHLFLIVKLVVESPDLVDYEEKMKYLKILRAQLSNHEQIMLFYNWLSSYGAAWEDKDNHFFTEYKMIHNLWTDELFQDEYIASEVNKLIDIYNLKYKGKKPLFEFQGEDFEYKMEIIKKEN